MKRDNELVSKVEEVLNAENLTEEQKAIISSLKSDYENATYKEYEDRHDFYRNMVSRMTNDISFEDKKLAKFMASEHPTLQQNFMRFCVMFIKEMANKSYCDARNENSVSFAKSVMPIINNEGYFPYI